MATVNSLNQDPNVSSASTGNFFTGAPVGSVTPTSSVGGQKVENLPFGSSTQQNSSAFPNLQKYVNANQGVGQQLGDKVENNINQQAQSFQQGVNQAQGNLNNAFQQNHTLFQNSVATPDASAPPTNQPITFGSQGFLQNIINKAGQGISNQETQDYQNVMQGAVGKDFLNSNYTQQLPGNINALQNLANQTRNETGRAALLQQSLNQPQYSMGQGTLDSLILGTSAPVLKQLQDNSANQVRAYQNSLSNLSSQQAQDKDLIGRDITGARNTANALLTGPSGALPSLTSDLQNRVNQAQSAQTDKYNQLMSSLKQGKELDNNTLNSIGVSGDAANEFNDLYTQLRQNPQNGNSVVGTQELDANGNPVSRATTSAPLLDWSKYLKAADPSKINSGTVASSGDYARYNELAKLAGLQPTLLNGTGQGIADTASSVAPTFDTGNAIRDAKNILSELQSQASQSPAGGGSPTNSTSNMGGPVPLLNDNRGVLVNPIAGVGKVGSQLGDKVGGTAGSVIDSVSNAVGTVICTELLRQGLISKDLWQKDQDYGKRLSLTHPHLLIGYKIWATPFVHLMRKSPLFTSLVKYPFIKWAHVMAGDKSVIGSCVYEATRLLSAIVYRMSKAKLCKLENTKTKTTA